MSWWDNLISAFSDKPKSSAQNTPSPATAQRPPATQKPENPLIVTTSQYSVVNASFVSINDLSSATIRIDLFRCTQLKSLPRDIKTGSLNLTECTALEQLPEGIEVSFLDLEDCKSLKALPESLKLKGGRLNLRNCALLTHLPDNMGEVAQLNLAGCINITSLPAGLSITSWIDIGRSGIEKLPMSLSHVSVLRDGQTVAPETIFVD